MQTETIAGSAYWASYLVNGDDSGIDAEEKALADAWLEHNGIADVLDVGEQYYSSSYGLHTGSKYTAGDLADYVVALREELDAE
jgi:hypothetical protein